MANPQVLPKAMPSSSHLIAEEDFIRRHLGPDENQISQMLAAIGVKDLDELISQTIPASLLLGHRFNLGSPQPDHAILCQLDEWMKQNKMMVNMLGLGYYDCYVPPVIQRSFLENPGWYTAYTPYQAEISQGRLELLTNFQQLIMDLTGMAFANASLLDEATAAGEAMTLAKKLTKNQSMKFFVDEHCFPQTLDLIETRAAPLGIEVKIGDLDKDYLPHSDDFFAVLVQYPNRLGHIGDISSYAKAAHDNQAVIAVATDLLALMLLRSPGELDADIVLGNSQRFGVPLGYGGPHAAFFAVRDGYQRHLPGRLIGRTKDTKGRPALRMALQTREQHIRRAQATSNICTSQVLLANMVALYAVYHGPDGLRTIATRVHRMARLLALGLTSAGEELVSTQFFDTVVIKTSRARALALRNEAEKQGYNLLLIEEDRLSISCDETTSYQAIQTLLQLFSKEADIKLLDQQLEDKFELPFQRTDDVLTHPVFHKYQTETKMLRYMRSLQLKDIGLDRSMIPLGSCTMKLNATAEMVPVSWPSVNSIHPFAPAHQTKGYARFLQDFSEMLKEITGFHAISLQPNSGAQGEYAGLLAIRRFHHSRGESQRLICLIPSSSHGTNPASAVLAGFKVQVVGCDKHGNVDMKDLKEKALAAGNQLAALMITYPSTHGVFEDSITDIADLIHQQGGLVYMDGANLNAMVGLIRPVDLGMDVCHINLHKTFCIPHGGGGPGMGPIGVIPELADFLPGHWALGTKGAVAAAPYGSASILPISWAYMKMMGTKGLTQATKVAILNTNYLAQQLMPHYPILYKGKGGRNAHECIVDIRPLKKSSGVTDEDIAKRLIDYGFHAPTMSFPVAGTLMIEPTESEGKEELDKFINAMISIRKEIAEVESGKYSATNNVLRNAPHTLVDLYEEWDRPYTKQQAFFPLPYLQQDRYFPPVNRIDNVYGDRNLNCSCLPLEAYR